MKVNQVRNAKRKYLDGHLDCKCSCDDPERDKWNVRPEHDRPHCFLQENHAISHQIHVNA